MWAVFRKDLMVLVKDSGALSTLFLMPLVFIVVFSFALGGQVGGGERETKLELPVVYEKTDKLAKEAVVDLAKIKGFKVEETLDGRRLTVSKARDLITGGKRRWAVVFPSGFSNRLEARKLAKVRFIVDPAADLAAIGPVKGTVSGILTKISSGMLVRAQVESIMAAAMAAGGGTPGAAGGQAAPPGAIGGQPAPVRFTADEVIKQVSKAGAKKLVEIRQENPPGMKPAKEPNIVQHNVPAYTTMFVFFIVVVLAESVLSEKANGTFRRLLAAPISKASILAGKMLPYYFINVIQVAIMFGVGRLVFGMGLGRSPVGLAVMTLALAAAATSLGILVSAFARTNAQVSGLGVLLVIAMAALGGVMIPLSVMPEFMKSLGRVTPHSWALSGFQDIIVRGYGAAEILPEAAVLLGFAAVFFTVGLLRFRFE